MSEDFREGLHQLDNDTLRKSHPGFLRRQKERAVCHSLRDRFIKVVRHDAKVCQPALALIILGVVDQLQTTVQPNLPSSCRGRLFLPRSTVPA